MYVVNNKLGCFGKGAPATACVYLKALLCILFFFRLLDGLNTEVRVIIKAELLVNTFWCKWEKTQKQQFPLNMSNFYLASELPRGENCHILAVDVLPFFFFGWISVTSGRCGDVEVLPKVLRVVEDRQSDWAWGTVHQHQSRDGHPWGQRRPPIVLPEQQQLSPQTNALQNDRITRKKEEEKKTKMCTS